MQQIHNRELEQQGVQSLIIQMCGLSDARQREDLQTRYLRYGKPFRPRIIGIDPIKNAYSIKAGIITEVR